MAKNTRGKDGSADSQTTALDRHRPKHTNLPPNLSRGWCLGLVTCLILLKGRGAIRRHAPSWPRWAPPVSPAPTASPSSTPSPSCSPASPSPSFSPTLAAVVDTLLLRCPSVTSATNVDFYKSPPTSFIPSFSLLSPNLGVFGFVLNLQLSVQCFDSQCRGFQFGRIRKPVGVHRQLCPLPLTPYPLPLTLS